MPKVPQVFAGADVGGTGMVRASPALADMSALQQGLGSLAQVAQELTRPTGAAAAARDEAAKIEAELAMGEMERQYAEADIALKTDPTVTPDTYSKRVDENLRAAQQGVGKALSPNARPLFERSSHRFVKEKGIKGLYEAKDLGDAQARAGANLLLRGDETQAIFGATPEIQEQAILRGLTRLKDWTTTKILTPAEADARTASFFATIQEGQLKREALRNPAARTEILDGLMAGKYGAMPSERQLEVAEAMMKDQEAAAKRITDELEKEAEKARKSQVDNLDTLADAGKLTPDALQTAIDNRVAVGEDARRLAKKVREGIEAGGKTDDALFNRLELDLLENPYSRSAKEIRRMQEEGKLAATGPRSAATLLKLVPEDAKDPTGKAAADKDITQKPLFKQGLHEIRVLRGGKGPLESLTSEAATRLDNAEREYHDIARSGKFDETQLPEVARKIVDRVRAQTPLQMGDPEKIQTLRYQTPKDLLDAKKAGLIPEAEFNRQFRLMQELGILQGPRKDLKEPAPAVKPPAKGAPSGGR